MFRFHQEAYRTNVLDQPPRYFILSRPSHDSLESLTMNVSDQASQQLYRASDTPQATNKTYEAGRCEMRLDERRRWRRQWEGI